MGIQIHEMATKSGNLSSSDFFVLDNGSVTAKIDYTKLAKAIVEQYNGSTLAGSAQTLQNALNGLNTNKATKTEVTAVQTAMQDEMNAVWANYGCKNLLPMTAKTQTINGVTFTVNSDGSITANGTATETAEFVIGSMPVKRAICSASPSGSSTNTYRFTLRFYTGATLKSTVAVLDSEYTINSTYETVRLSIIVASGQTVSNLRFYPMIRPASIPDDTYVPYAPNNAELATQEAVSILDQKNIPTTATSYSCAWSNYRYLLICATFYGNIQETMLVPTVYFKGTTNGTRVHLYNSIQNLRFDCYKDGTNAVFIQSSSQQEAYGVRIFGIY